jgi:regulator of replication initiation timing
MDAELFGELEKKVEELLAAYVGLKHENIRLTEENQRLIEERGSVKNRIEIILEKLEGIESR